jgi:hypothetical protein
MENHHFQLVIHYKWAFSIAMLKYQRVHSDIVQSRDSSQSAAACQLCCHSPGHSPRDLCVAFAEGQLEQECYTSDSKQKLIQLISLF